MMAQFMTNDRADATIVDRRIGIGIEERRLQDFGWKHDLDHAEIGIGIDLHRSHAPFPSVDVLTQLTNFIVVLKLAQTQRIAEQLVAPDLPPRIITPFIRIKIGRASCQDKLSTYMY